MVVPSSFNPVLRVAVCAIGCLTALGTACAAFAQTTERVDVNSAGAQATDWSTSSSISGDGRFVLFTSAAANLVAGDTNGVNDVFVRDRLLGITQRVSVSGSGAQANAGSSAGMISADGRLVAFSSDASNLIAGDTNGAQDVFVRNLQTGTTERASLTSSGAQVGGASFVDAISADGRFVGFSSIAANVVAGDTNGFVDVFVRDRQAGTTGRVSISSSGAQGDGNSTGAALSADGRFVAFLSNATNLVAGDTNGYTDVFLRDRTAGTTTRVSVRNDGSQGSYAAQVHSISADGRYVAFYSAGTDFVPGDTNGVTDVFVRDRQAGTTERVSVGNGGVQANAGSSYAAISGDGRFVAFLSFATNLVPGDTNGYADFFLRDRQTGSVERLNVSSRGAEGNMNPFGILGMPSINADGRFVAYSSDSSTLVGYDTNGVVDVFVRARADNYDVTVDLAQTTTPAPLNPGLLHGVELPDAPHPHPLPSSLALLDLGFWRLGLRGFERYPQARPYARKLTMILSDRYIDFKWPLGFGVRPWQFPNGMAEWEQFVRDEVANHPPVEYWDVWNEPDNPGFQGTWSQLLEIFMRAARAVRSADPTAKLVGPSITFFDGIFPCQPDAQCDPGNPAKQKRIFDFISELAQPQWGNTRLDAISWHDFSDPRLLVDDPMALRALLQDPQRFNPPYSAELHVNEYGDPVIDAVPGMTVAWIDRGEQARLSWLSKACWDMWDTDPNVRWSNCYEALNGLYMRDLVTPQQIYYVHSSYADLTRASSGYRRVGVSSGAVHAVAGAKDSAKKVYVLLGLAQGPFVNGPAVQRSVQLKIKNYSYHPTSASAVVRQIPNRTTWSAGVAQAVAGSPAAVVFSGPVPVVSGIVTVPISFADRDAYIVEVTSP